ncbi:hypothetical protein FQN54_006369 [Arachnomyces sp. PD_36]|nr:hypothetical protein FQN54_006369 [Arachnomyces sp. PD_36]
MAEAHSYSGLESLPIFVQPLPDLRTYTVYCWFVLELPTSITAAFMSAMDLWFVLGPTMFRWAPQQPSVFYFYPVMGNVVNGKVVPTIFSTQDESVHEMMKRPIAQVYAMTNLKTYEPLVESTEAIFFSKLGNMADEGKSFDLGTWLHWFATDVIMEITFGKRFGFLEREEDVDGIIQTIEERFCWIISWCQQNVQAGSDSTAITLTAVIYHLLRNPDSMEILLTELDSANLPSPVSWDVAHKLPYLDACIKEALRMNPAIGIPLERVAPAEGMEICGKYFKPGTVLGVNAWVVHNDNEVYGEDAPIWRPGRWVEASEDERKDMERTLFAFGGGSRICLGRNISYLEMYKVIPELLTRFKFELKDPEKEWSLKNGFFVYTKGVEVTIHRRGTSGRR